MPTVTKFEFGVVGRQLEDAADRLGLSQIKLAKLSGVSRRQIGMAFKGANISLATLAKLARVLRLESISMGDLAVAAQESAIDSDLIEHAQSLVDGAMSQMQEVAELLRGSRARKRAARPSAGGIDPKLLEEAADLIRRMSAGSKKHSAGGAEESSVRRQRAK